MRPQRYTVNLTTDAAGAATGYTSAPVAGRVLQIQYIPDGSAAFDNTVDMTITGDSTGQAIVTETNVSAAFTHAPRQATQDQSAAAALYAAGGTAVRDFIYVADERIKIVIAQGGNTKSGRIDITVG